MNSKNNSDDFDGEPNELAEAVTSQASSTYKVLGDFSDDSGAGVLGKNTAESGTPIGVEGAVPNASSGYGLSTPHDANVGGTAELGGLAGTLTGNTEITNLLGESLTVDGSNTLQVTSIYVTNTFDASGISWDAVTGLASPTPIEILIDTKGMNAGRLVVDVDGTTEIATAAQEVRNRIFRGSSVSIDSEVDFGLDTRFTPTKGQTPTGVGFKPDGTKMYVTDSGHDTVYEYDLSSAWDVSTASYSEHSLDISSEDGTGRGLALKDDGSKLYLAGGDTGKVYSYSLSTAWDISTASLLRSFDPGSLTDVAFESDGTTMFLAKSNGDIVTYDLTSSWDLGTAQNETWYSFSDPEDCTGIGFTDDGTELYTTDNADSLYWYDLSTGWDLSTKTLRRQSDVSADTIGQDNLSVKGDGSLAVIVDTADLYTHQFTKTFDGAAYASVEREQP